MPIYAQRYISDDVRENAVTSYFHGVCDENKGQIFGLLSVVGPHGFMADRLNKFVWDGIFDSYKYSKYDGVIDSLKEAVSTGLSKASELIKNDVYEGIDINFALVVYKGRGVYITVTGEQEVSIYKNGGVVKVSEIINQNKGVVASMAWSDLDMLIMNSPKLLDPFWKNIENGLENDEIAKRLFRYSDNFTVGSGSVLLSSVDYYMQMPQDIKSERKKKEEDIEEKEMEEAEQLNIEPEVQISQQIELEFEPEQNLAEIENEVEAVKIEEVGSEIKSDDIDEVDSNLEMDITQATDIEKEALVDVTSEVSGSIAKDDFKSKFVRYFNSLKVWVLKVGGVIGGGFKYISDLIFNVFSRGYRYLNDLFVNRFGKERWYKRMMSKVSLSSFGKRGVYGMKIDGYKDVDKRKKRFAILFFVIISVVLTVLLVNTGRNAAVQRTLNKEALAVISDSGTKLDEIEVLRLTDIDSARSLMFEFEENFGKLDKSKLSVDVALKYASLEQKYLEVGDALNGRVRLSENSGNIELFLDGRGEFGDQTSFKDIVTYKDDFQNEFLIVTDAGNKSVYLMNLSNKSFVVMEGSKKTLSAPTYVDAGNKGIYVFDNDKGVFRATFGNAGKINGFKPVDSLDRDIIGEQVVVNDMAVITANDNVYFLSNSESSVIKATAVGNTYTLPSSYIDAKSLASAKNLANDISIYATTSGDRGLERYSFDYVKGAMVLNRVSIDGVADDIGDIACAYSGQTELSNMFIFDSTNKRLVMLEKPIESGSILRHPKQMLMLNQYVYDGVRGDVFENVVEIASDYRDENIYVLDGNKIWKVKLK